MSRIPSFNRKVRVVADWTLAFLLKREVVALGQLHTPREEFTEVTPPLADTAGGRRSRLPVNAGTSVPGPVVIVRASGAGSHRRGRRPATVTAGGALRPGWWNGRHGRLKSGCRKACGFETRPGHASQPCSDPLIVLSACSQR